MASSTMPASSFTMIARSPPGAGGGVVVVVVKFDRRNKITLKTHHTFNIRSEIIYPASFYGKKLMIFTTILNIAIAISFKN